MNYIFSVKRTRHSVTQGSATVYLNGVAVVTFGDEIKLIEPGQTHYGEIIGGWASTNPDNEFIKGVLWHPFDHIYHYKNRVEKILKSNKPK